MWSRRASSARRVGVALVLASVAAFAEDADETAAELLFREGRTALERHDYPSACAKLERSQELDAAAGTLILLAFCHERQGHHATAYELYVSAAELAGRRGDANKAAAARRFAEAVRGKRHHLVVVVDGDATRVTIELDERALPAGRARHELALDPGAHVVVARSPSAAAWQRTVRIPSSAGRTILNIPPLATASEPRPEPEPSFFAQNALALGALGIGVVGVGVGSYFGLRAFSDYEDSHGFCTEDDRCEPRGLELREDARRSATISNIGFAVGLVGIGVGTVLLMTAGDGEEPSTAIAVAAGPSSVSSVLTGRF